MAQRVEGVCACQWGGVEMLWKHTLTHRATPRRAAATQEGVVACWRHSEWAAAGPAAAVYMGFSVSSMWRLHASRMSRATTCGTISVGMGVTTGVSCPLDGSPLSWSILRRTPCSFSAASWSLHRDADGVSAMDTVTRSIRVLFSAAASSAMRRGEVAMIARKDFGICG
eukprot:TRINITY_DN5443_c1_g1_i2.p1 TRINITY_DN5443_c1_g1~~TRINITY_DN5443_c1_g1_i2.p1  ORF type:complete len:169 (-),score=6.93 TRINITY_DN5443_c1_g1_i2:137-643(-)